MKIILVTPAPAQVHTGNRTTADRWARLLRELGHEVAVQQDWNGELCDLLIALHARRSFPAIQRFREQRPRAPLILALTGTDVYRDLEKGAEARRSVDMATKIVVLQELALEAIPESSRAKARVIYQSAEGPGASLPREKSCFQVCVLAHLRAVKDPLRAAYAVRDLPTSSRIVVKHAGAVLDPEFQEQVEAEQRTNRRYRWLGPLTHSEAMNLLARSHQLALTSRLEGGANVVSEAIAVNVPVISSRIPGSVGILGKDYPGYFPAGDTAALRELLKRAESDEKFYQDIQQRITALRPLVSAAREREAWAALLAELSQKTPLDTFSSS
ncbi:MAG TPA: selenoneine biosynthesis selenosugar synthase SenB [Candidatus Acidoferrum sp.]|nr:selenoneine biosynthesis selenosugar synthase SenB [Candidatus Acidoferrum sp.]